MKLLYVIKIKEKEKKVAVQITQKIKWCSAWHGCKDKHRVRVVYWRQGMCHAHSFSTSQILQLCRHSCFFPWLFHVPSAGTQGSRFILLCLFLNPAFAFIPHWNFNWLWPHDVRGLRVAPQQLVGAVLLHAVVSVWGFPFFDFTELESLLQLCVGSACVKSDCNSHLISQLKDCSRKLLRGLGYFAPNISCQFAVPQSENLASLSSAWSDLHPRYFLCCSEQIIFRGEIILAFPLPFSVLRMLIC